MEDARESSRVRAAARGVTADVDGSRSESYCEYTVHLSGAIGMRQRVRLWKAGGLLREISCSCVAEGCAYFDTCSLPEPG